MLTHATAQFGNAHARNCSVGECPRTQLLSMDVPTRATAQQGCAHARNCSVGECPCTQLLSLGMPTHTTAQFENAHARNCSVGGCPRARRQSRSSKCCDVPESNKKYFYGERCRCNKTWALCLCKSVSLHNLLNL